MQSIICSVRSYHNGQFDRRDRCARCIPSTLLPTQSIQAGLGTMYLMAMHGSLADLLCRILMVREDLSRERALRRS